MMFRILRCLKLSTVSVGLRLLLAVSLSFFSTGALANDFLNGNVGPTSNACVSRVDFEINNTPLDQLLPSLGDSGGSGGSNCDPSIATCFDNPSDPFDPGTGDPTPECTAESSNQTSTNASERSASTGNPIHLISGNKYKRQEDLPALPGELGLEFTRHYNSGIEINRGLGVGWSHTYDLQLQTQSVAPKDSTSIRLIQSDGRIITFHRPESAVASNAPLTTRFIADGKLVTTDIGYEWHWHNGRVFAFDDRGLLEQITQGSHLLMVQRDHAGRILSVTDAQNRRLSFRYEQDYLGRVTDPAGNHIDYKYTRNGELREVVRPDGTVRKYLHDSPHSNALLTGIVDERGITIETYRYDADKRAVYSAKADGVEAVEIEYGQYGDVADDERHTIVTNSLGNKTTHVIKRIPYGNDSDNISGTKELVTEVRGPGCTACSSSDVTYDYNNRLQVTKVTQKNGDATYYEYDDQGRTTKVYQQWNGAEKRLTQAFTYEGDSHRPSQIDRPSIASVNNTANPNQFASTQFTYNDSGNVTQISAMGFAPSTPLNDSNYNPDNSPVFDPNAADAFTPSAFIEIEQSWSLEYDRRDNLIAVDGPREDVEDIQRFTYDNDGRLTSITSAEGLVQNILSYDVYGRPNLVQSGTQSPISIEYTRRGLPSKVTRGLLEVNYEYDQAGNLTAIIDPNGLRSEIEYDGANRATVVRQDGGPQVEIDYDTENQILQRDLLNTSGTVLDTVKYLYDAERRLTQKIEGVAVGKGVEQQLKTEYSYDAEGNLEEIRHQDMVVTRLEGSNVEGWLSLIQPGNVTTQVHLDDLGRPTGITDANGNTTYSHRDDFGRVVRLDSADTGTSFYDHDAAGNVTVLQTASGNTSYQSYDADRRLIQERRSDDTVDYRYHKEHGRLISVTNKAATETFAYDQDARLTSHTRTYDNNSFTTAYEYNDREQLERKTLPDGQVLRYHYYDTGSEAGKLRAITKDTLFGFRQVELLTELDTNPWDGSTQIGYGNGLKAIRYYNDQGQIERIETDIGLSLAYTYDAYGNITGIDTQKSMDSYAYDGAGRLVQATQGAGNQRTVYQYQYDEVGNRTQSLQTAANDDQYDQANKNQDNQNNQSQTSADGENQRQNAPNQSSAQTSASANNGASSGEIAERSQLDIAEEGQGNRLTAIDGNTIDYNHEGSALDQWTDKGHLEYEYNSRQRPIKLYVDGKLKAEYAYNGFGERIKKTVYNQGTNNNGSEITYYLYEGQAIVAEANGQGKVTDQYVYHNNQPLVKLEQSKAYYLLTDHLGTPKQAVDQKQNTVWEAEYSPFGKATIQTSKIELNLRFPGQYEDQESGTHYNYYRDYNPETGRYITSDPIGLNGGINTFAYVGGNPVNFIDPLGL